jgi:hypothetical protein
MVIYLKEGEVKSISLLNSPDALLYPLETAPLGELLLKGFKWLDDLRPKTKNDIFKK